MAELHLPDAAQVSTSLDNLEKLSTDEYIIAFGPNGRHFFATPNGYSASQLPMRVVDYLTTKPVRKVRWASYGSDSESWFFVFEMIDGTFTFHVGARIPAALRQFINQIRLVPNLCLGLRVQLGGDDSFVAWSRTSWVCYGVPAALEARLVHMSGNYMRCSGGTNGSFRGTLSQVTWHKDGSYYLKGQKGYASHFRSSITCKAWRTLWSSKSETPSLAEYSELVLVALDSHAPVGETFVFIKKQGDAQEAPFVFHVHQDTIYETEAPKAAPAVQETRLQQTECKPERPKFYRWAISTQDGRPHLNDSWELQLKKNEKLKVWEDRGNDWFIVEGRQGVKGWAHGTWIAFCGSKVHQDPRATYTQFQEDMQKLLVPGQLREFPPLSEYMDVCSQAMCEVSKSSSQLGFCVHDLQTLLEGSGSYCYEWLKEERVMWHPDKFARYCHPEHKEELKASAQEMFVLYGVLMDICRLEE
ncbi:hypothetical protein C7974DRAFT_425580 [Boeremia exigua]|uniref:uncharacterized protein n=1 Tax=Boeremia exigua TaxID=749465 RepID=UPI001E8E2594|nr:uncharacterized protein C7974DRAFT_425580 [Boeremia exigua]KAH6621807.1 hypothetical protein C7974DRAFT_425580 [Boeremia exigua]